MKLVIATRNPHKLEEIRAMLSLPSLELVSLDAYPDAPEVIEDSCTFEGNAVKKAVSAALATDEWTLADDSGLEVVALKGEPGVHSARYAGEPADYAANNAKLLKELTGIKDRRARFCCVVALSSPAGMARMVSGYCSGCIIGAPRGTDGFGYDPLFVPDGHELTFAELGADVKNRISHRSLALMRARDVWSELFTLGSETWPPLSAGR